MRIMKVISLKDIENNIEEEVQSAFGIDEEAAQAGGSRQAMKELITKRTLEQKRLKRLAEIKEKRIENQKKLLEKRLETKKINEEIDRRTQNTFTQ